MVAERRLVVVADDYGIGPETSRGILELGLERRVTASVLLVNSPFAADAVAAWGRAGRPLELGWHPNLTLDRPVLPPERVPSLVDGDGGFWRLGAFLRRVTLGRIRFNDVLAEFTAQYRLFQELVGYGPAVVNSHQHVALFPPIGRALLQVLDDQRPRPFVRDNREGFATLRRVPGARIKRVILAGLSLRWGRAMRDRGYPRCDSLLGVTDPPCVADEQFLTRWLSAGRGATLELMCHPGHDDETLLGRDCDDDAGLTRRVHEYHLLRLASFPQACRRAGVRLVAPSELTDAARRAA